MMGKRPLAVVTMVYNDAALLPVWLRHYDGQVGRENCYIIDHGSDDGSTAALGPNVVTLPRTPLDEWARAHAVRDFCCALFMSYRHVLFVDADEFVVPDPDIARDLPAFVEEQDGRAVLDLFGMDVRQVADEPPIDLSRSFSSQRRYARPLSALCKPTLLSKRFDWHIGFHHLIADHRPTFRGLYLFHVAYCDDDITFARQRKRNATAPVGMPGSHHLIRPKSLVDALRGENAGWPRRAVRLREGEDRFEDVKRSFSEAISANDFAQTDELWRIPDRFVGLF